MSRILLLLPLAALMALTACKDNDRRRDRDRDDEPRQPSTIIGKAYEIPACGDGKLGYVTMNWPTPLEAGQTMRIEFSFEQSADAHVVDDEDRTSTPARLALFFQRKDDDDSQRKLDQGYRQFSLPRTLVTPGDHVLEVALLPANWNYGKAGFEETMSKVENVGFTLAGYGGPSFGHGVCMKSGTAKITVTGISVQ